MPDILIRDLSEQVVAAIDAQARRLGLSRNEYLRRELSSRAGCPTDRPTVTVEDLRKAAEAHADLLDPEVMARAWS